MNMLVATGCRVRRPPRSPDAGAAGAVMRPLGVAGQRPGRGRQHRRAGSLRPGVVGRVTGRRLIVPRPAVEFHRGGLAGCCYQSRKRSFDSSERRAGCLVTVRYKCNGGGVTFVTVRELRGACRKLTVMLTAYCNAYAGLGCWCRRLTIVREDSCGGRFCCPPRSCLRPWRVRLGC